MDSSFAQANWKIQCFKDENPIKASMLEGYMNKVDGILIVASNIQLTINVWSFFRVF